MRRDTKGTDAHVKKAINETQDKLTNAENSDAKPMELR